jgi:type VI secretion system protein ImpE
VSALKARALFEAGRLQDAVASLGEELRSNPSDARGRTFLFELLCFAGEFDRAEKQLDVLARTSKEAGMGSLLYRSALHAARLRRDMFAAGDLPTATAPEPVRGALNGEPFESLTDADPRIGARLEVFAAGQYTWIPFSQIAAIRAEPPGRLRDLLWLPAQVRTAPEFQDADLGEVLLPALTPLAWRHPDEEVRLGRTTVAEDVDGLELLAGRKMLLVDGDLVPLLEIRELHVFSPVRAGS